MVLKAWIEFATEYILGDGVKTVRIEFNLREDICPQTCENFRLLCKHKYNYWANPAFIKGIYPGYFIQAGAILDRDPRAGSYAERKAREGGEAFLGGKMKDENFTLKHDRLGVIGMANSGPDTNGCQFYIGLSTDNLRHMDGKNVVFGEVAGGAEDASWKGVMELVEKFPNFRASERRNLCVVNSGAEDRCVWSGCTWCEHPPSK